LEKIVRGLYPRIPERRGEGRRGGERKKGRGRGGKGEEREGKERGGGEGLQPLQKCLSVLAPEYRADVFVANAANASQTHIHEELEKRYSI
jgi:hypothetical protein